MSARMRLVGWEVRPMVMVDDGENLTPLDVTPQLITAAGWPAFTAGGDAAALDSLRQRIEHSAP